MRNCRCLEELSGALAKCSCVQRVVEFVHLMNTDFHIGKRHVSGTQHTCGCDTCHCGDHLLTKQRLCGTLIISCDGEQNNISLLFCGPPHLFIFSGSRERFFGAHPRRLVDWSALRYREIMR